MTRMKNAFLALAVLGFGATGCSRYITRIQSHPTKNVTLLETVEGGFFSTTYQFWQCSDAPDKLVCKKTCDTKTSDLECYRSGYFTNLP